MGRFRRLVEGAFEKLDEINEKEQARQVAKLTPAERERYGQQGLYSDMANQGYKYNYERMMANCMEARGWAPKQNGPLPMPKLTW